MPRKSPFVIVLSRSERDVLESRAKKYTLPYRDVLRAKIVLYAAAGLENQEIARRLDTSPPIVCKWRKRYFLYGIEGLQELPRRARVKRRAPKSRR